jgi:ribosome-associated heat shock protein Hsp15
MDPVRLDKWLWAARLLKTRALAAEAIKAGRVQVNDVVAKPAKEVRPGDRIEFRTGPVRLRLLVLGTAQRRGPATEATKLYEETVESKAAREQRADEIRLVRPAYDDAGARPTKRDRRRFEKARRPSDR